MPTRVGLLTPTEEATDETSFLQKAEIQEEKICIAWGPSPAANRLPDVTLLCRKPYAGRGALFGCGQCTPCRINRRRQWAWRQWFESLSHEENCFVTLTYAPGQEPGNPDHGANTGSLSPEDVRLWLYRLRKALAPIRVRYFLCGEYGDQAGRPHYHLSLFGVSGFTVVPHACGKTIPQIIEETWAKGLIHVGEFNEITAQYVCGYIVKNFNSEKNLNGRYPEFARMSRRPGIGSAAMATVASALQAGLPHADAEASGDVPHELRLGGRKVPLGRFLREKLRVAVGYTPEYIAEVKSTATYEKSLELSALLDRAIKAAPNTSVSKTSIYLQEVKQAILQVEARYKLFKQKRSL